MSKKKVDSKKIDIFYLGLPKCGSTWLYEIMDKSENVITANPRDLHFFDLYYERGKNWFHKFFNYESSKKTSVSIDICHDYILNKNSISNILKYNPEAKIIYHFRDPFNLINSLYNETSISGFIYFKELGYYKPTSKEEFIEHPLVRKIINFDFHINQIIENFKKDNILIFSTEFIFNNQKKYIQLLNQKFNIDLKENKITENIIRPNSYRFFGFSFLIRFLSYISFLIRRNGSVFFMKLISLKSIFNSHTVLYKEKVNNKKIHKTRFFEEALISELFISVNGCNYSDFISKFSNKIKIYN